jgi:hypothetical protein
MNFKSIFSFILFVAVIWAIVCIVKPYWTKYNIGNEVEVVATYGTKHDIDETKKMLIRKITENEWPIEENDFSVKKNDYGDVTISITYNDEINIFGMSVKSLEMNIEREARFVKAIL